MNVSSLVDRVGGVLDESYELTAVDVPVELWSVAVRFARDELGCDYFDFLTAVDESEGMRVLCHLARPAGTSDGGLDHLVLRTRLPAGDPVVGSIADTYGGADWHERETAEMFGVRFVSGEGAPLELAGLLLPPGQPGHPLRKDFRLPARDERAWPGAKGPT